jgi:hypothetical protein
MNHNQNIFTSAAPQIDQFPLINSKLFDIVFSIARMHHVIDPYLVFDE